MQELQNGGKTDSELWKNYEGRWLQLFNLVEKQCQEQIIAQQEQFHNQIQPIQEEIRNLIKFQISNSSRASCDTNSSSKHVSLESQMGFFSGNSERNESVTSYPESKESEMQLGGAALQPDCAVDGSSMSSGYGTFCVSELNTSKANSPAVLMDLHAGLSKGQDAEPGVQADSLEDGLRNGNFYVQTPEEFCTTLKEDINTFPGELEHNFLGENKISEVYSGKTNSKCITTWAQKLKQNQPKKVHTEDGCSRSQPLNEQSRKPTEKFDIAAAEHPRAVYLCKTDEDPNSWLSDLGTGLTYWKLEEKDMYHSLPGTLEKSPLPSSSAARSASQVLTLDPTLHVKPSQQTSGTHPHSFLNALDDRIAFSPDSVLEPSMSSHSDIDSFSQSSNVTSQLSGFPKYPSNTKASPVDSWKNHAFPNESRSNSPFPSVYTFTSNDVSVNIIGEENIVAAASASVSQSQLPGTANSVPECISLTSLEDPVILSKIRQNLKEKHARHIADLRAYYESEINSLKQKLEAKETSAVEELKKTNQILTDRCGQLDSALIEATSHVRTLENKNNLLEVEVNDLRERFSAASSASKILQERIEEMRTSNKEKDNTIIRLKSRLQDLEEAFESAYKLSDDKEARLKQESKMFQDMAGEKTEKSDTKEKKPKNKKAAASPTAKKG